MQWLMMHGALGPLRTTQYMQLRQHTQQLICDTSLRQVLSQIFHHVTCHPRLDFRFSLRQ